MALWTPAEITTFRWYKASVLTLADNDAVSSFTDLSPNADHAVQATSANRPTFKTGILNGQPVVRFASDDYLRFAKIFDSSTAKCSIFVVYKMNSGATYGSLVSTRPAFGSEGFTFRANSTTQLSYFHTGYSPTLTIATPDAAFLQAGVIRDGLSVGLGIDGSTPSMTTISGYSASSANYTDIGNEGGSYFYGDIAEIVILDINASTDIYHQITGYLAWEHGLQASLPADHPYKSAAPTIGGTTAIFAMLRQQYMLEGGVQGSLSQFYNMTNRLSAICHQLYGLQLLASLVQYYGDAPVFRRLVEQWYGSAAILRKLVEQKYHDARLLQAVLDQEWAAYGDLLAICQQRYSISQGQLQALAEQNYNVQEHAILQRIIDQLYVMAPHDALVQGPTISVVTDGGDQLDPYHINLEHDEGEDGCRAEIHLARQDQYLLCRHLETVVTITVDADQWTLVVEAPRMSAGAPGQESFIVPLVSPVVKMDAPYAEAISQEFSGMASSIVGALAAAYGVVVVWQLCDWHIPAGVLFANSETPLAVVKKVVGAVGGIVQASPAGELVCRPRFPLAVNQWSTSSPAHYLTDQDNFFSVDSTPDIRDGFNRYLISDQDSAAAGLTLAEIAVDAHTKRIRVYQVPFDADADIRLRTSGGPWVTVAADGIKTETLTELVEIIAGEGHCQHPIYELISRSYKQAVLGAITIAEDGHLRTELADNSLVEIVYVTKFRQFTVRSPHIEDVQFYPEEVKA